MADLIRTMAVDNVISNAMQLALLQQLLGAKPERADMVRQGAAQVESAMTNIRNTFARFARQNGIERESNVVDLLRGYDVVIDQSAALQAYLQNPSPQTLAEALRATLVTGALVDAWLGKAERAGDHPAAPNASPAPATEPTDPR